MSGYTSTKVCEVTGVTYRQLDTWIRNGVVEVSGDPTPGNGYSREFTPSQVARISLLARLRRLGLSLAAAQSVAADIEAGKPYRHEGFEIRSVA